MSRTTIGRCEEVVYSENLDEAATQYFLNQCQNDAAVDGVLVTLLVLGAVLWLFRYQIYTKAHDALHDYLYIPKLREDHEENTSSPSTEDPEK